MAMVGMKPIDSIHIKDLREIFMDTPVDDRRKVYDDPLANFQRIADILNGLGFRAKNIEYPGTNSFGNIRSITPIDVAAISIAIKLGRLMYSPNHVDSIKDIAGYAECWLECFDSELAVEEGEVWECNSCQFVNIKLRATCQKCGDLRSTEETS